MCVSCRTLILLEMIFYFRLSESSGNSPKSHSNSRNRSRTFEKYLSGHHKIRESFVSCLRIENFQKKSIQYNAIFKNTYHQKTMFFFAESTAFCVFYDDYTVHNAHQIFLDLKSQHLSFDFSFKREKWKFYLFENFPCTQNISIATNNYRFLSIRFEY